MLICVIAGTAVSGGFETLHFFFPRVVIKCFQPLNYATTLAGPKSPLESFVLYD